MSGIKINESYNRKFEDKEFDEFSKRWHAKKDDEVNKKIKEVNVDFVKDNYHIEVEPLDVPAKDQDNNHTYTYVSDEYTANDILSGAKRILSKDFKLVTENIESDPYKLMKEANEYEPIMNDNGKFLSNAYAYYRYKDKENKKIPAIVNILINSIKIDSPEFDNFKYNSYKNFKFIVFIHSDLLYCKSIPRKEAINLLNKLLKEIKEVTDDNWKIITLFIDDEYVEDDIDISSDEENNKILDPEIERALDNIKSKEPERPVNRNSKTNVIKPTNTKNVKSTTKPTRPKNTKNVKSTTKPTKPKNIKNIKSTTKPKTSSIKTINKNKKQ